jgi:hypothetical protein
MAQKVAGRAGTRTGGAEDGADLTRLLRKGHGGPSGEWARFRALIRRLHHLGPRPTGELLGDVVTAIPEAASIVAERLEVYGQLDPRTVAQFGADDWLEPTALFRTVGGRP